MNDALPIQCPHCWEEFTIPFDASEGSARFTIDCEVCCRPMEVIIHVAADGEIDALNIEAQ